MNKQKRIKSLFEQFAMTIDVPTISAWDKETKTYNHKFLKLDFNSVYGGYRLDWVNEDTSESFFYFSNRFSNSEMSSFLQGLIIGYELKVKSLR